MKNAGALSIARQSVDPPDGARSPGRDIDDAVASRRSHDLGHQAEFVRLLTDSQPSLLAYAATLVGNLEEARDVLQEANVVLWQKADTFELDSNFLAWARKIVYYRVLAQIRDRGRQRVVFDDEVVRALAADDDLEDASEARLALRDCITQLSKEHRTLIVSRYYEQDSIEELSRRLKRTSGAIRNGLMRIRRTLMTCVEAKMAEA